MFSNEVLFFGGFILVISVMLLLDLGVFNKKDHIVKFGEAAGWTVAWIALALVFYCIINTHGDLIHGVNNFAELEAIQKKYASHIELIPGNFEESL